MRLETYRVDQRCKVHKETDSTLSYQSNTSQKWETWDNCIFMRVHVQKTMTRMKMSWLNSQWKDKSLSSTKNTRWTIKPLTLRRDWSISTGSCGLTIHWSRTREMSLKRKSRENRAKKISLRKWRNPYKTTTRCISNLRAVVKCLPLSQNKTTRISTGWSHTPRKTTKTATLSWKLNLSSRKIKNFIISMAEEPTASCSSLIILSCPTTSMTQ